MGVEPHVDDEGVLPASGDGTPVRRRPNVSGDLPMVFEAAPMFRRTLAGYDRFQVDSYVQWAEEELATADREREHLTGRHLRTEAALAEARELLSHSSAGGEFLQLSRRLGTVLATAADQAEDMLADADADRRAAAEQIEQATAEARAVAERAVAEAELVTAAAASEAAGLLDEARRFAAEAERTRDLAEASAAEGRARIHDLEQRAAEHAEQVLARAEADAVAARLHARDEVVALLTAARTERQRADDEAARVRAALDAEAAERRSVLIAQVALLQAEVAHLEGRRASLQAENEVLAESLAAARAGRRWAWPTTPRLAALRRTP